MHITNNLHSIQRSLDAQRHFIYSLSSREWFSVPGEGDSQRNFQQETAPWPETDRLKETIMAVTESFAEIKAELRYAKREAGWDHLGPKDLVKLTSLLNNILASLLSMLSVVEVTTRIDKRGGWDYLSGFGNFYTVAELETEAREVERQQWRWIFQQTRGPTEQLLQAMDEGIDYIMYSLRLRKKSVAIRSDHEANRNVAAKHLDQMIGDYLGRRQGPLKAWFAWKGMDQPSQVEALKSGMKPADSGIRERHQFELYLFLDVSIFSPEVRLTNLIEVGIFVH